MSYTEEHYSYNKLNQAKAMSGIFMAAKPFIAGRIIVVSLLLVLLLGSLTPGCISEDEKHGLCWEFTGWIGVVKCGKSS